jgi:hypothetical protein
MSDRTIGAAAHHGPVSRVLGTGALLRRGAARRDPHSESRSTSATDWYSPNLTSSVTEGLLSLCQAFGRCCPCSRWPCTSHEFAAMRSSVRAPAPRDRVSEPPGTRHRGPGECHPGSPVKTVTTALGRSIGARRGSTPFRVPRPLPAFRGAVPASRGAECAGFAPVFAWCSTAAVDEPADSAAKSGPERREGPLDAQRGLLRAWGVPLGARTSPLRRCAAPHLACVARKEVRGGGG